MQKKDVLLARQPIFDRKLNTYAYELLFRPNITESNNGLVDSDQATSMVMLNAYTEIGIQNLVGEHKAFINFTRNLILSPPPFTNKEIVIEVLEDISPDEEIIKSLADLKKKGYLIALDDFIYHDSLLPLVELAHIIKVDVLALSQDQLFEHVTLLKKHDVLLLAEKVETQEMQEYCMDLGFDYFQGYFLSKPKTITGKKIPANKLVVMQLLADLQSPDINSDKLHDTLSKDPGLSFKMLRLINSAAYRRPHKIESLHRAIILIGSNNIKRWASLLALTNLDDKPSALHEETMLRAKMCEFLGKRIQSNEDDLFFTLGMLSMLEAFFDAPMKKLLESVSLTNEMNEALLERKGLLGFVLSTCESYEQGRWDNIDWKGLKKQGLSINDVREAYLESLEWTMETGGVVMGSAG